ncbi:hypothetical protein PPGU19_098420 (plasmid) [Paraburkholderia sp. PGU19]|nr:hypothetical protein PPGU19_098420 [Paraburkholderia sp. PGU19]
MAEVIVDTCVWIDVSQGILDVDAIYTLAGSELVHVSAISLGELAFGAQRPNDARDCTVIRSARDHDEGGGS